jgi:hypothetical protein
MSLKLTSGYRLDLMQIARILKYCAEHKEEGLSRQRVADAVGLSSARVGRLWMMGTALGLFEKGTWSITDLGLLVREYDAFLDDIGTLWLLHYILAANPDIIVWNIMTNSVVPENRLVTMEIAKPYFVKEMQEFSSLSYEVYLNKEIRSYFDAYTEQKFQKLHYLETEDGVRYVWGHRESVPPSIAFACILLYRDRFLPDVVTVDLPRLSKNVNTIGRVFNLNERQLRDLLEEAKELGYIYVETRADLDQIRFRDNCGFLDVVRHYYEER